MTPEEYKKHLDENMNLLADEMPDSAIAGMAIEALLFPVGVFGAGMVLGASLGFSAGAIGGVAAVLVAMLGWLFLFTPRKGI